MNMKRLCLIVAMCVLAARMLAQENVVVRDTLNHWLTYGIPGQTVLDSLGKPDIKGEFEYWESDANYHQNWEYPSLGLTLWMVSDTIGSLSKVEYIKITDEPLITSTFVTTKGIRIGTPKKQVLDLYDAHIDKTYEVLHKDPNLLLIGNLYGGTIFHFTDEKVTIIEMGYLSE